MNWLRPYTLPVADAEDQPQLVTIPNVELFEVGEDWHTSTGTFTFTEDDVASAVAATDDPAIRTPTIKFGHTDPRFTGDGDMAVGRVLNLRASANGQTCIGDYVGVPLWLAKVLPSAYPRRSIEGMWDGLLAGGRKWDGFYLSAVALLGAYYPAIGTLEDLENFWKGSNPPMYDAETGEVVPFSVAATSTAGEPMPTKRAQRLTNVAAAAQVEDIRRQYYESLAAAQMWWWIRAMYVEPPELIVDDDEGQLYRVPYTISGDAITFGDPKEVVIQYVDAGTVAASGGAAKELVASYPSRAEAVEGTVAADASDDQGSGMTDEQKQAIGLEADASEDEVNAKLAELAKLATTAADPEPAPAPTPPPPADADPGPIPAPAVEVPEGFKLVDETTLQEMQVAAGKGVKAFERQETADRDALLDKAISAGKFPRARRKHYEAMLSADPEGTKALIGQLEPGLVPVTEVGVADDTDASVAASAYPDYWFPELRAARNRQEAND